jgi:hypothetical protein
MSPMSSSSRALLSSVAHQPHLGDSLRDYSPSSYEHFPAALGSARGCRAEEQLTQLSQESLGGVCTCESSLVFLAFSLAHKLRKFLRYEKFTDTTLQDIYLHQTSMILLKRCDKRTSCKGKVKKNVRNRFRDVCGRFPTYKEFLRCVALRFYNNTKLFISESNF